MAGRIPQSFIDDLVSRVDIVELIHRRVPLKKAGREYTACCPFHDEKTPSFTVSPTKQFYHCFGCGAHGTAIGFLMEYEHLDFVEAIQELANQLGVEVVREQTDFGSRSGGSDATAQPVSQGTAKPLYAVMEQAATWYRQQLATPIGQQAIDYLKARGLSGDIAKAFGIGYAPPGWDGLMKALGSSAPELLVEAGLVIEKEDEGKRYDRFRERVMFPIRDRRGRVIAFGGRVLGDGTPKYLNSPETPIFHKGRELYGLYEARMALRELPRLLVVEGYMDVVALAQYEIRYAVATLGTATTNDHLERLFRLCDEVVFCFDGDRAGRKAGWRALENALEQMRDGRQVRFMFLPDGEDPDTLVRQIGREAFEQRIASAQPLSDFLLSHLREQVELDSLEGRARLVELARPLLDKLPHGAYRMLLQERIAQLTRLDKRELGRLLGGGNNQSSLPAAARQRPRQPQRLARTPLRDAIALLMQKPELAPLAGDTRRFSRFHEPGMDLLCAILELLGEKPHLTTSSLLEHWRNTEHARTLYLLTEMEVVPETIEELDLERQFIDTLALLERQQVRQRLEQLSQKPFRELSEAEKQEYTQLLRDK